MNIDIAYQRFLEIRGRLPDVNPNSSSDNEANTRLHLIDPILQEVLGWKNENIQTELYAGKDRLDYALFDEKKRCWFVVEAKKRSDLLVNQTKRISGNERLLLSGPVLKKRIWTIINAQMLSYIGYYGPEYGIITNGEQWIGFLARNLPPGVKRADSHAVVFRNLNEIDFSFEHFYNFFGYKGALARELSSYLIPKHACGGFQYNLQGKIIEPVKLLSFQNRRNESFYYGLRNAMNIAFNAVTNDPFALEKCFVTSRESQDADEHLTRMAFELEEYLQSAETAYPKMAIEQIEERGLKIKNSGFSDDPFQGSGYLARILGSSSSGKSTFLRRLYYLKFASRKKKMTLIWIDCAKHVVRNILGSLALSIVIRELFGEKEISGKDRLEVYKSEWNGYLRALDLDQEEGEKYKNDFLRQKLLDEKKYPEEALVEYLLFSAKNRNRLPVIILDNMDNEEIAFTVAQFAVMIFQRTYSFITVASNDAVLLQLRKNEQDYLSRLQVDNFWLPRPKVRAVLENRLEYLRSLLQKQAKKASSNIRGYVGRSELQWTVSPDEVVKIVNTVLLDHPEVSTWIGKLCNYDMRKIFEVCRAIILSPHIEIEDLLHAQAVEKFLPSHRVLKTLITPKTHQFQVEKSANIINVFGFSHDHIWYPLLPARILVFLRATETNEKNERYKANFAGFLKTSYVINIFKKEFNVAEKAIFSLLKKLHEFRLIRTFDPVTESLQKNTQIKVTPRGKLHLDWALKEQTYVYLMAEVDPVFDDSVYSKLRELHKNLTKKEKKPSKTRAITNEFVRKYLQYILNYAYNYAPISETLYLEGSMRTILRFEHNLQQMKHA